jgi:septal ring factor EnvC (AmiA/AmiB activator)
MTTAVARAMLAGLVLLLVVPAFGQGDLESELREGRNELEEMRKQIERTEAQVLDLEKKESSTRRRLDEISAAMKAAMDLRFAYERQVERLDTDVSQRSADLDIARANTLDLRRRLGNHIDRIYRRGKPAFIGVLFGADDFGAGLRRARYVANVLSAERALMKEYRTQSNRLEIEVRRLRERQAELTELKSAQLRESQRMERLQAKHASVLNETQRERKEVESLLISMQESAKALEELIERLEEDRLAAKRERARRPNQRPDRSPSGDPRDAYVPSESFSNFKGKLRWPTTGKILERYGKSTHPTYGTATFNSGIDIQADAGDAIRAVADGQVEFVDWVAGYGKTVILSHGDGYYTLYAHASRVLVSPGDRVKARDSIALVGSTDSLRGDCLRFELRKGGKAVNPLPWLNRK